MTRNSAIDAARACPRQPHRSALVTDAPTPLSAGASLKNGIEIVALTSQTSIENRYSAKRVRDGKTESIALRERSAPTGGRSRREAPVVEAPKPAPARAEDPNGPSAKTAELKPLPAQTNGTATAPLSLRPRAVRCRRRRVAKASSRWSRGRKSKRCRFGRGRAERVAG